MRQRYDEGGDFPPRRPILCFYEFQIGMQPDLIAHDQAAGFRDSVPVETEVLTVDLAIDRDAGAGIAPGILDDTAEFGLEFYGLCSVTDGQVAVYIIRAVVIDVLIFGGYEFQLRMLFRVEEIRGFQVGVALFGVGSDRIDVGGKFHLGGLEIFPFRFHRGVEFGKPAGNIRNHHVFYLEFHFGVRGIEYPFCRSHNK